MMRPFSWKLKKKAAVLLLLFTVVPIIFMGFISNLLAQSIIAEKSNNLSLRTIEKLAQYISGDLQYDVEVTYNISQNQLVRRALKEKTDNPADKENMQQKLKRELNSYNSINRIKYPLQYILLSNQGELYTSYFYSPFGDWQKVMESIRKEAWYPSMSSQVYEEHWIGLRPNLVLKNGEKQIYFACNIIEDNVNYGVLLIGFSQSYFSKTMDNFKFSANSTVFLKDGAEGTVLHGTDANNIYGRLSERSLDEIPYGKPSEISADHTEYIATKMKIQPANMNNAWTLCMLTPASEIYREISLINYVTAGLAVFAIISVMVLMAVINRWLVVPIINLSKLMNCVKKGDLEVRARETQKDEIGQLENGFNSMVEKLQDNIDRIRTEEEQKRKLEIEFLQAQINPHFIRNTLNTIRWMAELKRASGISHAITSFIKLMDYSFREQNTMVTVDEEMNYLNEYVYLQRLRYQNKFSYTTEVDEKLRSAKILKLLLQPIVENSILHGLERKKGFGTLSIRVYSQEDKNLMVTIEDDGVGIESGKIQEILDGKGERTHRGNSHIGLSNVRERIQMNFGKQYGMTLSSEVNKGTKVEIRLPIIWGEEHEGTDY